MSPWFHVTACSRTPSAIAEAVTDGRSSIRPSIRAATAPSAVPKPTNGLLRGRPTTAVRKKTPRNESTAASTHTSASSRATGMPSMPARSERSAAARTATPAGVRRRNRLVPTRPARATSTATTWSSDSTIGSSVMRQSRGRSTLPVVTSTAVRPHSAGTPSAAADSSCDRPMVATVSTRRDDRLNRRMAIRSTAAPSATALTRPTANATGMLTPRKMSRQALTTAGTTPSWPWAKLMMRLARQVSAMPTATRAPSAPSTTP